MKPRKIDFENTGKIAKKRIIKIEDILNKCCGSRSFEEQLDILISQYCLNDAEVKLRDFLASSFMWLGADLCIYSQISFIGICRSFMIFLHLLNPNFLSQLLRVFLSSFIISNRFLLQKNEREALVKMLTEALSKYFASGANVCLFGSSITTLGTKDSDLVSSSCAQIFLQSGQGG